MRLLLVEDEKMLADALAELLKRNGYHADVAYDGIKGAYEALTGIHDLIILDRMLPGMNGIEIIKKIRAAGLATPVIFMTALGGVSDRVEGLDAGADDYLVKPFSMQELLARIRAMLRRKESQLIQADNPFAGEVRYDPASLLAYVKGDETKLTRKEGQLLELLLLNKGNVLSREKIFDKVWGMEADRDETIMEIYIHRLRKKVAVGGSGISIDTVRGVGYRLSVDD